MSSSSNIEWTDATWNPIRGCTRVSEGCRNCYAERMAARLSGPGRAYHGLVRSTRDGPRWTGKIGYPEDVLRAPLHWRKPRKVFVNSMGDLFHEDIPDEKIDNVFAVMAWADHHIYQILTKRAERMRDYVNGVFGRYGDINDAARAVTGLDHIAVLPTQRHGMVPGGWPLRNVWLSVSAEDQPTADERIPFLYETASAVRGVSLEPLLGPIDLHLSSHKEKELHWCIVGGESGPGARPMRPDWARSLRDQCHAAGIPFFFKQWGAWSPRSEDDGKPFDSFARHNRDRLVDPSGDVHCSQEAAGGGYVTMSRIGKKAAGRTLDGREWNEYPEVLEAVSSHK